MDHDGAQLLQAREAFERHEWAAAFDLLRATERASGLDGPHLEMLADAARWSRHHDVVLDSLERAETLYEREANAAAAARAALALCREHFLRNALAEAAGWLGRAARLLEAEPECSAHGHLQWMFGRAAWAQDDFDTALEYARQAAAIGRRVGDADLEALGLHDQGHVLIARGQVAQGRALIDEAAAMGAGVGLMAAGTVFCGAIWAYRNMADWRRAGEWTDASLRWCERQSVSGFPGLCRFHRAEVRRLRGQLDDAERDALEAAEELLPANPRAAAWAFMELGEIRRRRGDGPGARQAFLRAHELGDVPQPGLALLQLDEGGAEAALTGIREALSDTSVYGQELRATLLPAAVTVMLAAERTDLARDAVGELEALAASYGTTAMLAAANRARGALQLAEGDAEGAVSSLRAACKLWCEVEAPYEAAQVRTLLARALRAIGNGSGATAELDAAAAAFERLGAARDLDRVHALMTPHGRRVQTALMFTDIVGSSRLVETLGDAGWEALLAWHDRTLRGCFEAHGGHEVKQEGDGFFVSFPDAESALECAVAIQRTLADNRREHGFAPSVRIGVHATQATERDGDFLGRGVHEAARLGAAAGAGEVLASRAALDAAGGRFPVSDARLVELKGLSSPLEVVVVDWE